MVGVVLLLLGIQVERKRQALQLLTVIAVGFGLACYGLIQGRRERRKTRIDPRQQPLFPSSAREDAEERQLAAR